MARNTSEANLQIAPEKLEDNAKNLSDLRDDILGHILSFMETKEAVRTSTLSKRWKYVRTFTPNLVFDDFCFWFIKENLWKQVGDYVAREIHLRGFVRSFGFEVRHYGIVAALLRSWITELVMRNVQDVSLLLNSSDEHNVLPDCLFTCKSLVHFKFSIGGIVSLELPATIYFSNLKTLNLRNVRFLNEHSTNQLFSSCPVLEDLTLNDCRWSDFQLINICAPKLLRLTIFERVHFRYTNPSLMAAG
ncbi:LOW QUALITY PROTEIN: putative FBD-associated F-box protein At5g56700 [Rosa chinensis]|uniref:LOW QUALITY PROTEIN: putative FBD-associated F-box protein At5g56700 n=1 Tax=Rosa chinensis TaxID=74649 RepID=UPI000D093B96|nr:LOW QUALITY PROTEIN: putative FBD-associated F-box protein At5g56700 [Rosa chinensis]